KILRGPPPPEDFSMPRPAAPATLALALTCAVAAAQPPKPVVSGDPGRVERIRGAKMPAVTKSVMFDTPEADAICSALQVFPPDNPWNLLVEDWPVHPNSQKIVASVGTDKPLRYNPDMGFVLVPPDQKRIDMTLVSYPHDSHTQPHPLPP